MRAPDNPQDIRSEGRPGIFRDVSSIQRVNTVGGRAPTATPWHDPTPSPA